MAEIVDYAAARKVLAQSRVGLDVALLALTALVTEMFGLMEHLLTDNEKLRDQVWASERAAHANDEMEPEDG